MHDRDVPIVNDKYCLRGNLRDVNVSVIEVIFFPISLLIIED